MKPVCDPDHFKTFCQLCSPNTPPGLLKPETLNWPVLWQLAVRHRVVPVLTGQMTRLGIAAPEDITCLMTAHNYKNLLKGMNQSAELVRLTQLFQAENIPFLAFKGIAFNHLAGIELSQRHTGDMDILLTEFADIARADKVLTASGYQRKTMPNSLLMNAHQKKHFIRFEKDVIYYHPDKKISLELHFKLCMSEKTLPVSPKAFYAARSEITIGTTVIPVMSKVDHQLYLLVHGAVSRWFRLKWLHDIPVISNNGRDYQTSAFLERMKCLGIERMVCQGLLLSNELLNMPVSDGVAQSRHTRSKIATLVQQAKKHLSGKEQHHLSRLEKQMFMLDIVIQYLPLLRKDLAYKIDHFRSYLMRKADWEVIALPSALFWLYYPLRPLLWLRRQL